VEHADRQGLNAIAAILLAAMAGSALAQESTPPPPGYGQPVYVEVLSLTPVTRQIKINEPREQCHKEEVLPQTLPDRSGSGAQLPNNDGNGRPVAIEQTRCDTVVTSHYEQRQFGYDVRYRYGGKTYQIHLPYDPGSRLLVNVAAAPARAGT
jgi:uncharacterized protein YcfJ